MHPDMHLMLKEAIATAKAFTQELPDDPLAATMQILGIGCEQAETQITQAIAVCKYAQEQEALCRKRVEELSHTNELLAAENTRLKAEIERLGLEIEYHNANECPLF